jgi:hypothetical protein
MKFHDSTCPFLSANQIAPSAANNDGTNVIVFPENLRRSDKFFVEREVQFS